MANYIEALAQSGGANAQADAQNAQALEQGDLDDMLDSIRDLSQSGARGAARSALSDLQNLLDNLRLGGQSAQSAARGGRAATNARPPSDTNCTSKENKTFIQSKTKC